MPASVDDEDPVLACPECDRTGIRSMVHNDQGVAADHERDYYCRHCGAAFDEPVERPPHEDNGDPGYLAGKLAKTDADEVSRGGA